MGQTNSLRLRRAAAGLRTPPSRRRRQLFRGVSSQSASTDAAAEPQTYFGRLRSLRRNEEEVLRVMRIQRIGWTLSRLTLTISGQTQDTYRAVHDLMMGFVTLSDDPRTRALASSYSERTAQLLDGRGSAADRCRVPSGPKRHELHADAAPRDTGHDSTLRGSTSTWDRSPQASPTARRRVRR